MSSANYLEKLLDGAAVEWKPLGEVLVRTKGTKITAGQMRELHKDGAPVKIFAGGKTVAFVDLEDIPKKDVNREPSIIVKSRGVIEFEYYDKPFSHKNEMWSYNASGKAIDIKYVYHFLKLNEPHFQKIGSKMQMPQIATPDTDKFNVPIPCPENPKKSLEIQAEIARILDTFTELSAKLSAELSARKKQYNHYRDRFLSFEEGAVEFKYLSEIAYFYNAKPHEKLVSPDGEVALLTAGFISTEGRSARYVKTNDVLTPALKNDVAMVMSDLPNGRALAKTFFIEENGRYAANQRVCLLRVKEPTQLAPKFLHYVMNRNRQLLAYDSGVDQTHLKKDWILSVTVPVPPLAEQNRIVSALDKFDILTSSIAEGLPREIELRQKQYEHYRNLLLSFPKPEEVEV